MAKPPRPIDRRYFRRYAGSRDPYWKVYRAYSGIDALLKLLKEPGAPKLKRITVLGTASGQILKRIWLETGVRPHGCEIVPEMVARIPAEFRRKVKTEDLRDYLKRPEKWDLIFSNSLMYLPQREIPGILKRAARITRYFHFEGSFLEARCPDEYRQTLRSLSWWEREFERAGFQVLRTAWGKPTHLYESRIFR